MATLYIDTGAELPTFRPAADYLSIATAALGRGFKVTPVSPAEKARRAPTVEQTSEHEAFRNHSARERLSRLQRRCGRRTWYRQRHVSRYRCTLEGVLEQE